MQWEEASRAPNPPKDNDYRLWVDKHKPKKAAGDYLSLKSMTLALTLTPLTPLTPLTQVSDLCGNQEQIKKLTSWLSDWKRKLSSQKAAAAMLKREAEEAAASDPKKKAKAPKKPAGGKDKEMTRAVLISGPPGIGKSTAAALVAKDLGFEVLEFQH